MLGSMARAASCDDSLAPWPGHESQFQSSTRLKTM